MSKLNIEIEKMATILYNMSSDMDYADYEDSKEEDIKQLENELRVLQDNKCACLLNALATITLANEQEEIIEEKSYPVSREKCSSCSMCSLVTKTFTGAALEEHQQYYQCLAGAEYVCGEDTDIEPQNLFTIVIYDTNSLDDYDNPNVRKITIFKQTVDGITSLISAWKELLAKYEGYDYRIIDNSDNETIISGAFDPSDIDVLEEMKSKEE